MAEKFLLLASQKNEVCQILESQRTFSRSDFHWREAPSRRGHDLIAHEIVHTRTGFFFHFDLSDQPHYIVVSPGRDMPENSGLVQDWNKICELVRDWHGFLYREINTLDPWEGSNSAEPLLSFSQAGNDPLTPDEREAAKSATDRIEAELIGHRALRAEELAEIKETCKYLREAADRVGRRDWVGIAIGAAFQIALSVYPEEFGYVLSTFSSAIVNTCRWLIGKVNRLPSQ
jgi:hypothetical protein